MPLFFIGALFSKLYALLTTTKVGISILTSVAATGASYAINRIFAPGRPVQSYPQFSGLNRAAVAPARWVLGRARIGGHLFYAFSRGRVKYFIIGLSEGECEEIEGCWYRNEWVPLVAAAGRTAAQGRLLRPNAGSPYASATGTVTNSRGDVTSHTVNPLEIYEYLRADGTQGTEFHSILVPPSYDAYNDDVDYIESDGTVRNEPTERTVKVRYHLNEEDPNSPGSFIEGDEVTEDYITDLPEWGANHRLYGLSWCMLRLENPRADNYEDHVWGPEDVEPPIQFLFKGIKITWPGQAAKTWTENAAALRYWWETERRGNPASAFDQSDFTAAYNLCEQTVDMSTDPGWSASQYAGFNPVSKRYTINGAIESDESAEDIEDQMDAAWIGTTLDYDGKILLRPGRDRASVMTIDDSLILAVEGISPTPRLQDRLNAVDVLLAQSSAHDFLELTMPRYTDAAALARDGKLLVNTVNLRFVNEPIAGGRIQVTSIKEGRETLVLDVECRPGDNYELMDLKPADVVSFSSDINDLAAKSFTLRRVEITDRDTVRLSLVEKLAGTWVDTFVAPPLKGRDIVRPEDPRFISVSDPSNLALDEVAEVGRDGATAIFLEATWEADYPTSDVQWRRSSGGSTLGGWSEILPVEGELFRVQVPDAVGDTFAVRVRNIRVQGERRIPSGWVQAEHVIGGDLAAPSPVTNLDVESIPGGVRATWTPPTDDDYSHASVRVQGGPSVDVTLQTPADFIDIPNLAPGESYTVSVTAVDRSGNSSAAVSHAAVDAGRSVSGTDGEDGQGVEYVFARTPRLDSNGDPFAILESERPLDSWTFDQAAMPITRGRVTWHDSAPPEDATKPLLWRSERPVLGSPSPGDIV